jgi:hypothetical protein
MSKNETLERSKGNLKDAGVHGKEERIEIGAMSELFLALDRTEIQIDTLDQLREKFRACWVRGSAWRLEVGELLYKIKEKAEHGEWGIFLDEFGLARSTADDYVRRYADEAQITAPRQYNEPTPDPEANGRMSLIEEEHKKREGRKPSEHATELHIRIKDVKPYEMTLYKVERMESPDRVKAIWQMAFIEIIGDDESTDATDEKTTPAETEGAPCSA